MIKFGRYAAIFLTVLLCGYALLLIAGLIPQSSVMKNIQLSAGQLSAEGYGTQLLVRNDETYQLDNFTETRILLSSLYMDVQRTPQSVLINPTYEGDDVPIEAIQDVAEDGEAPQADTYFAEKVIGLRGVVRILLSVMNIRQIRRLIMWCMTLLMMANALMLRRQFSALMSGLFVVSILCVNPVVIMSSIQYSCCFLIAMTAMLIMPYADRFRKYTAGMLFFIIGAVTQFLDYNTVPLITFGLPMLTLLLAKQRDGKYLRFGESLAFTGKCFLNWFLAYALLWIAKLGITELLTDFSVFSTAVDSLLHAITPRTFAEPFRAVWAGMRNVITIESAVSALGLLILWPFFLDLRPQRKLGWQQSGIYLVIAALPILWTMVASRAMLANAYYQYRVMVVCIFGACCFYAKPTHYLVKYKDSAYNRS